MSPSRSPKHPSLALQADRHRLYQAAVQSPEHELAFIQRTYRALFGRPPLTLREDFCGTALFAATWVRKGKGRGASAVGIDLDGEVLEWGRRNNVAPLGAAGSRVELRQRNVLSPGKGLFDVIVAMNYSYWIFRERRELLTYFRSVRRALAPEGAFYLDAYGGWDSHRPMLEPRAVRRDGLDFTYVWDQDIVDPINNFVENHIHFSFADGSRIDRAFTYQWRFWTLAELRELLTEAGFGHVEIYWDVAPNPDEERFRPVSRADNQPGWLVYLRAWA